MECYIDQVHSGLDHVHGRLGRRKAAVALKAGYAVDVVDILI